MPMSSTRPRRGQVLLRASLALFAGFAVFSVCMWYSTRTRFVADANLTEELAKAEFVEEPPPPTDAGWPQWRGFRRDGVAFAPDLLTEWPSNGPPRLWSEDITGLDGFSTFAVAGDRAFTMGRKNDDEVVLCFRPDTGETVWEKRYDPRFDVGGIKSFDPGEKRAGLQYGNGPRATPALDGGRVYTVGVTGQFQCRRVEDGELLWEHNLLTEYGAANPKWGFACSPLIDGGLVFVNPGGPAGKSLAAFDKESGKEVWKSQDDPAGYSSPVAITVEGERQIVFFTAHSLVGVAARDGALRWRFPWPTDFGVNAATPIPIRAKVGGKERHYLFITSGYKKGSALVALVPKAGGGHDARSVFESNLFCSHYGSPVRVGDHVYGFNESTLVCISLRTGKVRWELPGDRTGYKKGSLLAVNDYLLVLGEDGKLGLLKASPEGPEVVAEDRRAMRHKCWTMPVLVDGRLLLRDQDVIRCLDMRQK
jgi:outer membrane protein assembly factor BamB